MKTFKEIMDENNYIYPKTEFADKSLQQMRSDISIEFKLDDESRNKLRDITKFMNMQYAYEKRYAENILIANDTYCKQTNRSLMDLMNEENTNCDEKQCYHKNWK